MSDHGSDDEAVQVLRIEEVPPGGQAEAGGLAWPQQGCPRSPVPGTREQQGGQGVWTDDAGRPARASPAALESRAFLPKE